MKFGDRAHGERSVRAPDDERGAGLVEYALLVSLIAITCLVAIAFFGTETSAKFSTTAVSTALN